MIIEHLLSLFWNSLLSAFIVRSQGYSDLTAISIMGTPNVFIASLASSLGSACAYASNYIIGSCLAYVAKQMGRYHNNKVATFFMRAPNICTMAILLCAPLCGMLGNLAMLIYGYVRYSFVIFFFVVLAVRFIWCAVYIAYDISWI